MSFNIIDAIQQHVTQDELQTVATAIGAPVDKTRSAMSTGALGIVGSLLQRGTTPSGAAGLLETLKSPMFGGVTGLWRSFLGGNADKVDAVVAKTTGIGSSGAHSVLAALLPIVATVLGRKVTEGNLGADGLMNLLLSQRKVFDAIPGASAIAAAIGLPSVAQAVPSLGAVDSSLKGHAPLVKEEKETINHKKRTWGPIALAAGGLALAALFAGRAYNRSHEQAAVPERTAETKVTGAELPNGDVVVERLFEEKDGPGKITLSDVTFDFATANVHTGKDTIDKMATLMKKHPNSMLRIEGHTDSVGDDRANETLSFERAAAVKKELVSQGVDAKRIEVVGVGERHPVAPNDTEEGRAKNRRIDAVILKR